MVSFLNLYFTHILHFVIMQLKVKELTSSETQIRLGFMDEGKPNLMMDHQKQSKEEGVVHHVVGMDVEEAGIEDAHNNTHELMVASHSEEEVAVHNASIITNIVGVSMKDTTMQEEEDDIERLLADIFKASTQDAVMEEEEEEEEVILEQQVIVEPLLPVMIAEQQMHHFHGDNTDTTAEDPLHIEVEECANALFETNIDQDTTMSLLQLQCNQSRAIPWEIRTQAPALPGPTSPTINPINSSRQALLSNPDSRVVFVGMVEGDDNDWYDSIIRDAQRMEEMEGMEGMEWMDMENPGLDEIYSSLLHLPESEELAKEEPDDNHPQSQKDIPDLSPQDISKIWGLHPSEFGPNEPGPSTRKPRVAPLTDDEVAKFECGICFETLPIFDIFHGMSCPHKFCTQCMDTYIEGSTHAGEVPIPCPDPACKEGNGGGFLHPEDCKKSIDFSVFCSWSDQLTENAIPPSLRIYCPNRECKIMLETTCANKTPSKALCPACNSLMCMACGLYWSTDGSSQHDCAEGAEAMLKKKLASEHQWKQCPRCKMLVEKSMGCDVMTCR